MDARCYTPETVCLQCGDRGFTNAFVYCVKCLEFAVHRYCLDVIPGSVDEFVHWVCDNCKVQVQNKHAICKNGDVRCKTRDGTSSKHSLGNSGVGTKKNEIVALKKEEPVYEGSPCRSDDACAKLELVECAESATDYYPLGSGGMADELVILSAADERKICEESSPKQLKEEKVKDNLICHDKLSDDSHLKGSMKLKKGAITVSAARKDQHRLGNKSSKRPHEKCENIGISECAKLESDSVLSTEVKENNASEKRDQQHFSQQLCESDPEPRTVLHGDLSCKRSLGSSKKKKTNMFSEADLDDQRHRSLFAQHLKEHGPLNFKTQCSEGRGINISNESTKNRESEVSDDITSTSHRMTNSCKGFLKDSTGSSMVDCNMHAAPVIKPIWRGSFNIWNKNNEILDGLMAHISSRACQKACDETCQFQAVLHLEVLLKSDVWPKSFQTSEPTGENIALFFFPSEISERAYDHLVDEMAHKELALRAIVKNAELLIFTSLELPLSYWRFQGKYYLWGVFREKQHPALCSQSCGWEPRYNSTMRKNCLDNTSSSAGKMPGTVKSFDGRTPLSPLSNCSSHGSGTS